MIGVALEFTGESKKVLARLERETPRTFRAAHAAAATRAQNRLRKVMRKEGGVYGVPKFVPRHEMTRLMRPGLPFGGKLSEKAHIVKYKKGNGQVIGWVDRLSEWASAFQGAERYAFQPWQRRFFHQKHRSLDGFRIPTWYNRPERKIIDPFAADLSKEFPGMVVEMYNKYACNRMKKGQAVL